MANNSNRQLVDHLKQSGVLFTPAIIDAFNSVDRADFVSKDKLLEVYEDRRAMSIGYKQTISQPTTVAFMLKQLQTSSCRPLW